MDDNAILGMAGKDMQSVASTTGPLEHSASANAPVKLLKMVTNFESGGTESQVYELVRNLDLSSIDLEFACLQKTGQYTEEYQKRGLLISEFKVKSLYSPQTILRILQFARHLRSRRIQIVHSYNFYSSIFAIPAARLARVPLVIASIRDRGVYLNRFQKLLQKWVCRHADKLLVNADAIREWLIEEGYPNEKISVIKNGIDPSLYEKVDKCVSLRQEFGFPEYSPLVVMIARLNRQKGVEEFIRAAAMVNRARPATRFLLVGNLSGESLRIFSNGESRFQLWERLITDLNMQDKLLFTGHRLDVPQLLSQTSVSVLPSHSEGLSNTLLESMAAGVPIVSTNVGGCPELIDDGVNGVLVPPGNPEAIAEAVLRILDDPLLAQRLGKEAKEKACRKFSLKGMVQSTTALYMLGLGRCK